MNLHQAPAHISNRTAFNCNKTLRGTGPRNGTAQLPAKYHNHFHASETSPDFYAVYSYATPIAWFSHGQWTMPNIKYSATTSRHQSIVRKAVPAINEMNHA